MPFQDAGDRVVGQKVTQIGKRSLNPPVTPGSILFGHPDNQVCDFLGRSPSSSGSKRTAIIFLREQFSVPRQQSFWSEDVRHLFQQLPTKPFRLRGQSAALVVAESHAPITSVFSKNTILLDEIVDDMLLMLVHPAGDRDHNKRKRVECRAHPQIVSPESGPNPQPIISARSSF